MSQFIDDFRIYSIVYVVLTGIVVLPAFILWIASFSTCSRNRDPARRPFTILKVAFPLLTVAYLTWTLSTVLSVVELDLIYNAYSRSSYYDIEQAESQLAFIGSLFEGVGLAVLLLCVVDLGLSFLYIWNDKRTHHTTVLCIVAFFGVVLVALDIASFAESEILTVGSDYGVSDILNLEKLESAYDIILWILSLVVAAFSIYVFSLSRKGTELRRNADIYLAIGFLFLLRATWRMAYDIKYLLGDDLRLAVPYYINVLQPVLSTWPAFIILVLIYTIGSRNHPGFRSVHGPEQQVQQYYVPTPVVYMQPGYQPSPNVQQNYQAQPQVQQNYQAQPYMQGAS